MPADHSVNAEVVTRKQKYTPNPELYIRHSYFFSLLNVLLHKLACISVTTIVSCKIYFVTLKNKKGNYSQEQSS
jgi:hypothetical protein